MATVPASKKEPVRVNLISILEKHLLKKWEFRHNPILERTEFKEKGKKNTFRLLTERDVNTLFRDLNLKNIKCTITTLRSILNSNFIKENNPFEEYFTTLPEWDNVDYIKELTDTIKAENQAFWEWAFKKWIVNLVACAMEGTETANNLKIKNGINQQVLVFVGKQGLGKTTWLNKLLPSKLYGYLYSGIVNPSNKDTLVNLSENLIINLDELENLNKTELGSLKSLITQSAIRLRKAYGIFNENYVRRASFVGSVNEVEFLTDTTGNRRYLVVEANEIHYLHKISIDKVYSQAYHLYSKTEKNKRFSFDFKGEDIVKIDANNSKFVRQSTEEELLLKYFRIPEASDKKESIVELTPTDILNELQKHTNLKIGDPSSMRRIGVVLNKYKFQKISKAHSKPYQLVRIDEKNPAKNVEQKPFNDPHKYEDVFYEQQEINEEPIKVENNKSEDFKIVSEYYVTDQLETKDYGILFINGKFGEYNEIKLKIDGSLYSDDEIIYFKYQILISEATKNLLISIYEIGFDMNEEEKENNINYNRELIIESLNKHKLEVTEENIQNAFHNLDLDHIIWTPNSEINKFKKSKKKQYKELAEDFQQYKKVAQEKIRAIVIEALKEQW